MSNAPSDSLYKYFSKAGVLRFLEELSIRFTPLCVFNDPFEAVPTISEIPDEDLFIWERLQAALAISFGGNAGMFCLSEDPLNLLMWGHYCNAHQGAVVEFDVSHEFFSAGSTRNGFHQFLRKVEYSEQRAVLSFEHFQKNKMGLLNDHGGGWLELLRSEHPLLFTKSPEWSYEREWRLVRQLVETTDRYSDRPKARQMFIGHHIYDDYARSPVPAQVELAAVPAECVRSIYLGARTITYTGNMETFEEEVWRRLGTLGLDGKVQVNKIRFDPHRFALMAFDLRDREQVRQNVSGQEFAMRSEGFEGVPFRTRPSRKPKGRA